MTLQICFVAFALLAFNAPVLVFMRKVIDAVDFKHILSEKSILTSSMTPASDDSTQLGSSVTLIGSSARVVALMASIVLCCFLWGVGNYIIYAAFYEADKIGAFLTSVTNYFMCGLPFYTPYSVNKLTSAFKS